VSNHVCCSVCPTLLPEYDNAMITSGDGADNYFGGHELTYMCDMNFATAAASITCACDVTTDSTNPQWDCSPINFATTCLRCKTFYRNTK